MVLKPITDTSQPGSDVLKGGLTDAHFAAQLDQVVRSPEKYPVYGDPTEFFAVTYPTDGLKRLLTSTFGRLAGKGGSVDGAEHGVVRFQTSFGGGKTHGLIAAYHLANGARPLSVGEFVDPDLLPDSCRVAAAVGDTLDALTGTEIAGRSVLTMWGAIAAQLGEDAWDQIAEHDSSRSVPASDVWLSIFEQAPTLVIIDEVAAHIRALSTSGDPDLRRQAEGMPVFLFNLFAAAAGVDTARVVITLATETDAFGEETTTVEKILDQDTTPGSETKSVLGRFGEVLIPAKDEEISEIIRRRLFSDVNQGAAKEAGEAFADYYSDLEKKELRLDFPADFKERIYRSYPLHPELINVLDRRVGTIPEFQRTRGALRLLAETVADLWESNTNAVVINVADLPLAAGPVGSALTRGIGREAFAQVLDADVAGPGSHAAEVDRTRFASAKPYATRAATTVFLHSLEHTASRGAPQMDVMKGTLTPGDDPSLIDEALRLLDQSAWHLDYDGARWKFDTEPNPRKIVDDEKSAVVNSVVREELDRRLNKMFASYGPLKTKVFPTGPEELDDRAGLQLAVIHYETLAVNSKAASPPPSDLVEMLDTHGTSRSNRTYRNGVTFLVADTEQIEAMREAVRWDLAAQRIKNDTARMQTYADPVQDKLKSIADRAGLDARVSVTRCYRHLYFPKADEANSHLRHHELTPSSQGDQEKNQTQAIQQVLEELGKIRSTPISTNFLAKTAGFPATDPITTAAGVDGFWRNHNADIILNPTILTDAIAAGVRNGSWVYYDSDTEKAYTDGSPPPAVKISGNTWLYTKAKAEEQGILGKQAAWADVERELDRAKGELTGTVLRSKLEEALKSEPSKADVVEILSRVVKQDPPQIVVVDGEPTKDSKALSSSSITRISLDRITILSRSRAEKIGIEIGELRPSGFRVGPETGAAGPVFGTLTDKLTEVGTGKKITSVEITKTVVETDTGEIRTLLAAIPMLAKLDFTVGLTGSSTFSGLTGDVNVTALTGGSKDFRKVEKDILGLFDKADELTVELTLTYHPEGGVDVGGAEWEDLSSTITEL